MDIKDKVLEVMRAEGQPLNAGSGRPRRPAGRVSKTQFIGQNGYPNPDPP